jgi:hypothetical protein
VIELSKRFAVASRFTSLLVLESEAMFKAFGLDRTASAPTFTGEQVAESMSAKADGAEAGGADKDDLGANAYGGPGEAPATRAGGGGFTLGHRGRLASGAPAAAAPAVPPAFDAADVSAEQEKAAPPPPARPAAKRIARDELGGDVWEERRRRRMIPMRRVFDRHVGFDATNAFVAQNAAKLTVAESAFANAPDSRDRTVELFALYSTVGRVGEAQDLTAKWAGRDALDPDALQARADLAARLGDRERAVRILGGLADLRPNDRAVQTRLADLWDAAGNAALACEHRIALADIAPSEPKLVAAASSQGASDLASVIRLDTTERVRDAIDKLLLAPAATTPTVHGDVQISAEWSGGMDLDVALIDAQGKRTSWLGSSTRATLSARDVTSTRDEALELANLPQGNYVLEISRAAGRDTGDVARGEVTLRLNGEVRKVPFTLTGARAELGTVRVFFTSHLEPIGGGWRGPVF